MTQRPPLPTPYSSTSSRSQEPHPPAVPQRIGGRYALVCIMILMMRLTHVLSLSFIFTTSPSYYCSSEIRSSLVSRILSMTIILNLMFHTFHMFVFSSLILHQDLSLCQSLARSRLPYQWEGPRCLLNEKTPPDRALVPRGGPPLLPKPVLTPVASTLP